MKCPLFPLSAHILPEGRMALRIFEPRYIRMIKETCAKDAGFVICMLNSKGNQEQNTHIFPTGTYCRVIDFDALEDGLLGVTIEGINCVSVSNIDTEKDGLRIADCENVEVWSCDFDIQEISPMNERLREIFDTYDEFRSLYENVKLDDPLWVINRWLELLPVDAEQKQHFLAQKDCKEIVEYLSELIKY
ncbi:LON peptidase substrate-binding domain-containing protein [Glaciecola sp. 33A]|jgi:Lon protease-like protein|uniref:LON peptidase substrate-binding domain-containing protein n=1 Tax=Glaciecola sp. 33A TaxID=2057807 RepID=UPI000C332E50|nr:LON peptidase substrate-binding domain-containing protein [Glaciecola sp. 33A]PKI01618.1 peptidase S16 [Glaciecola sp. 33A]